MRQIAIESSDATLDSLVQQVELADEPIALTRHGRVVAEVRPAKMTRAEAIDRITQIASKSPPCTREEIRAWIDEGRNRHVK